MDSISTQSSQAYKDSEQYLGQSDFVKIGNMIMDSSQDKWTEAQNKLICWIAQASYISHFRQTNSVKSPNITILVADTFFKMNFGTTPNFLIFLMQLSQFLDHPKTCFKMIMLHFFLYFIVQLMASLCNPMKCLYIKTSSTMFNICQNVGPPFRVNKQTSKQSTKLFQSVPFHLYRR